MVASWRGTLPQDLLQGQSQFEAWRRQRSVGGRIPEGLWALAVRLVKVHGISRTAMALGLDYYSLKRRAEATVNEAGSRGPAFVELPSALVGGQQCLFELDNGVGATMRVQLVGYDATDVAALARSLWNGE
jgi:hypothetical protein